MAAVQDLSVLAKAHKAVAGPALPVTGGAERWDIAEFHQPLHDLIKRALIGNIELLGVMRAFFFGVASDRGA